MSAYSCGVSIFVWVLNVMWLLQSKWVPIFMGCLFSESVGGYSLPHWISMVDLDREIKAFVLTSLSNVLCWISMWCDRVVPKYWTKILGGKTKPYYGWHHNMDCEYIYVANRLQTWPVCKWATGLYTSHPVFKLVGPLSIIQSEVVPFRKQAERFESWSNGLEAGWMVYKQPEQHDSCISLPNKQPIWAEWHESWPNDLQEHTSKV